MQPAPKLRRWNTLSFRRFNSIPTVFLVAGSALSLVAAQPLAAHAQAGRNSTPQRGITARVLDKNTAGLSVNISADSAPYHLDWNGTSGMLTRHALGGQPEIQMPLTYLHSEPGPKGYAKYLAWFLARDKDRFSIAWCYLNDGGREFHCWLYQFPTNQLSILHFTGDYRFAPLPEPVAPTPFAELTAQILPTYTGPDFKFRDWTRRSGQLDTLALQPSHVDSFAAPLDTMSRGFGTGNKSVGANGNAPAAPANVIKTISGLRVTPLHELHVAKGNGWREGGWRELHALAFDSANDPYYLIMYSNVTQGYVVDLKRAQTFVADFGAKVDFSNDNTVFGAKEEMIVGPPDTRIRRYTRTEIPLVTTHKYDNPYNNVEVYMDFRGPDGKTVSVPGYWDGDQTWRVRFTPTLVGTWSWRSYSTDTELGNQVGSFTCVADDGRNKGFMTVNAQRFYPHTFATANGVPFLPVFLRDPVHYFPAPDAVAAPVPALKKPTAVKAPAEVSLIVPMQDSKMGVGSPPADAIEDPALIGMTAASTPRTFTQYTQRVDDASALGFNRFWGGWLLDPVLFPQHKQANEGGAPFVDYNLDTINPAYFQWMDRRIAYCNERGIVPDIGITDIGSSLLLDVKQAQINRLWQYVLARYSSFNVNWNLFGKSPNNAYPPDVDSWVEPLAKMTDKYDPVGHPLTTVVPNSAPQAPITPASTAPLIIRPGEATSVRPDVPAGVTPPASNPVVITPGQPLTGAPLPNAATNTDRQRGTGRSATGAPNPGSPGSGQDTGRSNSLGSRGSGQNPDGQTPSRGAGNSADSSTDSSTRSNRTGRSNRNRNSDPNAAVNPNGSGNAAGTTRGSGNSNFPTGTGRASGNGGAAGTAPQVPTFPGFPSGSSDLASRFAAMGGQGSSSDPRTQSRRGRGRGRSSGFSGGVSGFGGDYNGSTEVPGNTTQQDYVTIVDPSVAATLQTSRVAQRAPSLPVSVPIVRFAQSSWLDVITLAGGDLSTLTYDYRLNKPLVVQDIAGGEATDATRHRLWETIMRGGYWQGATTANSGIADPLNSAVARWTLASAHLFQKTAYARLVPHQDMLGGPEESPFERRRRKRAEAEAAMQSPVSNTTTPAAPGTTGRSAPTTPNAATTPNGGGAPNTNPLPPFNPDASGDGFGDEFFGGAPQSNVPAAAKKAEPGPIYVLADPGWEYVVYFANGGSVTLDLLEAIGTLRQSWYNPRTGEYASQDTMKGGIYKTFTTPDSNDWVLLLSRR